MKEQELRKLAQCCKCRKKIGQLQLPIFHRLRVERFVLNPGAVQRQHGLEQMMNGNVALAQVFSPGEDMAKPVAPAVTVMICDGCMLELPGVFEAMEQAEAADAN